MTLNKHLYSSERPDWETPADLFQKLHEEFKFNLDVCATAANAKVSKFFDIKADGLKQDWRKYRCWMNPPYGRGIDQWVKKAYESRTLCVCLLPVRSDTRWWHNFVMKSHEIRLLTRRLSFAGSNNKAPFPAAIVIFEKLSDTPKWPSLKSMVV